MNGDLFRNIEMQFVYISFTLMVIMVNDLVVKYDITDVPLKFGDPYKPFSSLSVF